MKKIFLISFLVALTTWAQKVEPLDTNKPSAPGDATAGSIAKPTAAQKETIKSAAKKAEANKKDPAQSRSVLLMPAPEVSENNAQESEAPVKNLSDLKKNTVTGEIAHRFGLHVDLNIPHILNYGVDYWHRSKWFSVSANLGGFSAKGLQKSSELPDGVDVKIANQEAVLRLHPFQSAFHLGLAYGNHVFEGAGTATYSQPPLGQSVTTTLKNKVTANYIKPQLGWIWRADSGFTWGLDIGYLIPNGGTVTLDEGTIKNESLYPDLASTPQYKANRQKIIDESEKLRTTSLPYWALARVGWLF